MNEFQQINQSSFVEIIYTLFSFPSQISIFSSNLFEFLFMTMNDFDRMLLLMMDGAHGEEEAGNQRKGRQKRIPKPGANVPITLL